jgi:hypothetical protein
MRSGKRAPFPTSRATARSERAGSLLGQAVAGMIVFGSLFGTLVWAITIVLAETGALDTSWPWWAVVRISALGFVARAVLVVATRKT